MRSGGIDDALPDRYALGGLRSKDYFHCGNQNSLFGFLDNKNRSEQVCSANQKDSQQWPVIQELRSPKSSELNPG